MITRYKIQNFKIHTDTDLTLAPLTILTGMNGMGKSSVIQSMLMLRESVLKKDYPEQLNLIGDSFIVGKPIDLINWDVNKDADKLNLILTFDNKDEKKFTFLYPGNAPGERRLIGINEDELPTIKELSKYSLFSWGGVQYLSAFREGPKPSYGSDTTVVDVHREVSKELGKGEYAVNFLDRYGSESVSILSMLYDGEDDPVKTVRGQLDKWLHEISPDLDVQLIKPTDSTYTLKYLYPRKGKGNIEVEAVNTGYGISYSLSVVVALLAARKGDLIMIENPEAHIHPSAQSALMRLISRACAGGVQVILETHSDHIVNGALVNIKLGNIQKNDVVIYFFDRYDTSTPIDIFPLEIGEDCRIKKPQPRFFSQMNTDMEILFDI